MINLDTSSDESDLLVLDIQFNNGCTEALHIKDSDDPEILSHVFCVKHGLSAASERKLHSQLIRRLEQIHGQGDSLTQVNNTARHTPRKAHSYISKQSTARGSSSAMSTKRLFEGVFARPSRFLRPASRAATPWSQAKPSQKHSAASLQKKSNFPSRFEDIFQLLNPRNGVISKETVDLATLPDRLHKMLKPLLTEVLEVNAEFTLKDFAERMNILASVLTPAERNRLLFNSQKRLKTKKKKPQSPQKQANLRKGSVKRLRSRVL